MKRLSTLACALLFLTSVLFAQAPNFKSQEELDAFLMIQQAADVPSQAAAGQAFLAEYSNSEAASLASYMTMLAYQQMDDFENMLLYGDMVLESEPPPGMLAGTLISLAGAIPNRTREFDLDKEEKLTRAEDYAKRAMALIPTLPKLDPNMTDDDWLATKMEFMSQCHEALGNTEAKRGNHAQAEGSLRKALEMAPQPAAFTYFSLAKVLKEQNKEEEAKEMAQQCLAAGGMPAGGSDLCQALL